jgi:hypothetical protein
VRCSRQRFWDFTANAKRFLIPMPPRANAPAPFKVVSELDDTQEVTVAQGQYRWRDHEPAVNSEAGTKSRPAFP